MFMAGASRKTNRYAQGHCPDGDGRELIVSVESITVDTTPGTERLCLAVNYAGVEHIGQTWRAQDAGWPSKTFVLPYNPGAFIFFWVSEEGSGMQRYLGETQPVQPEQLMSAGPFHEKWCGDLALVKDFAGHLAPTGQLNTSLQIVSGLKGLAKKLLPQSASKQALPIPIRPVSPAPVAQPVPISSGTFWRCLDQIDAPPAAQARARRISPAQGSVFVTAMSTQSSRQSSPSRSRPASPDIVLSSSRLPPRHILWPSQVDQSRSPSPARALAYTPIRMKSGGSTCASPGAAYRAVSSSRSALPVHKVTSSRAVSPGPSLATTASYGVNISSPAASSQRFGNGIDLLSSSQSSNWSPASQTRQISPNRMISAPRKSARIGKVVIGPALSFDSQGRQITPSVGSMPLPFSHAPVAPLFRKVAAHSVSPAGSHRSASPVKRFAFEGHAQAGSSPPSSRPTSEHTSPVLVHRQISSDTAPPRSPPHPSRSARVLGRCQVIPSDRLPYPHSTSPGVVEHGRVTRTSSLRLDIDDVMLNSGHAISLQVSARGDPPNAASSSTSQVGRAFSVSPSTGLGPKSGVAEGPRLAEGPRVWQQGDDPTLERINDNGDSPSSRPKARTPHTPASIYSRPPAFDGPRVQPENAWGVETALEIDSGRLDTETEFIALSQEAKNQQSGSSASRHEPPENLAELVAAKKRELQRSLGALRDLDKRLSDTDNACGSEVEGLVIQQVAGGS